MLIFLLLKKKKIIPNLLIYIDKHMETFNHITDKNASRSNLYMNLFEDMTKAIGQYVTDVKSVDFPNANEQY